MADQQDRKTVALALVGTLLILVANDALVKQAAPRTKQVVGFAIAFLLIGFFAEIVPKVAKYFAILVFLGAGLTVGPGVFKNAQKALGKSSPPKGKK